MKTFVYKLRPTPAQVVLLTETVETCRHLYNHALSERKTAYQERGESIGFVRQSANLTGFSHESVSIARMCGDVNSWNL